MGRLQRRVALLSRRERLDLSSRHLTDSPTKPTLQASRTMAARVSTGSRNASYMALAGHVLSKNDGSSSEHASLAVADRHLDFPGELKVERNLAPVERWPETGYAGANKRSRTRTSNAEAGTTSGPTPTGAEPQREFGTGAHPLPSATPAFARFERELPTQRDQHSGREPQPPHALGALLHVRLQRGGRPLVARQQQVAHHFARRARPPTAPDRSVDRCSPRRRRRVRVRRLRGSRSTCRSSDRRRTGPRAWRSQRRCNAARRRARKRRENRAPHWLP